jgi:hypothetical protein
MKRRVLEPAAPAICRRGALAFLFAGSRRIRLRPMTDNLRKELTAETPRTRSRKIYRAKHVLSLIEGAPSAQRKISSYCPNLAP